MTPDSNQPAEALLRAVLVGDRSDGDPEVVALFAARPDLAARYRRMKGLAERLDSVGSLDREVLAQSKTLPGPAPGAMRAALDRARGKQRFRWWPLLALAAALVIGAFLLIRTRVPEIGRGSTLGPESGPIWPTGTVTTKDLDEFRWELPLPTGGHYVLSIYRDAAKLELVLRRDDLENARWIPTPSERRLLPEALTWEVGATDIHGGPFGRSRSAQVSVQR